MRSGVVLRAFDVAKHNRVRMDTLRTAVSEAGFRDVRSHLQTGSLTLHADDTVALVLAKRIDGALLYLGLWE